MLAVTLRSMMGTDLTAEDERRWRAAFPTRLRPLVDEVLSTLPPNMHPLSEGDVDAGRGLWVDGQSIRIPMRQYLRVRRPDAKSLQAVEGTVRACIYSRHHDGTVRHNWLPVLLNRPLDWVAPYLVQLAGEYVVEIAHDIDSVARRPHSAWQPVLTEFALANPRFVELTRDRAASYWDAHLRSICPTWQDTPGGAFALRLQRWAREAQQS